MLASVRRDPRRCGDRRRRRDSAPRTGSVPRRRPVPRAAFLLRLVAQEPSRPSAAVPLVSARPWRLFSLSLSSMTLRRWSSRTSRSVERHLLRTRRSFACGSGAVLQVSPERTGSLSAARRGTRGDLGQGRELLSPRSSTTNILFSSFQLTHIWGEIISDDAESLFLLQRSPTDADIRQWGLPTTRPVAF